MANGIYRTRSGVFIGEEQARKEAAKEIIEIFDDLTIHSCEGSLKEDRIDLTCKVTDPSQTSGSLRVSARLSNEKKGTFETKLVFK